MEDTDGAAARQRPSRRDREAGSASGPSGANGPNALPVFCRARHFNRAANVYSVPLWDFTSRWLPEELKAFDSRRSARATSGFKPQDRTEGSEGKGEAEPEAEAEEIKEEPEGASDSEESEVAWEGPLGGESRAWSRAAADGALILLRRLGQEGASYAMGVSSALIASETVAEGADSSMDKRLAEIIRTREPHWAVCALRSGHFAGAVFKGQEAVVHKAIHRYTVRAKAGGAQSACDSGKKVKSVGSSLRRYGETRLAEEIKELMTDKWAAQLAECELVLVSVSKRMKSTLLGTEKEPFLSETSRVRKLPFMIGKPTFEAVQAAYLRAASVVFCEEKVAEALAARFRPKPEKEKKKEELPASEAVAAVEEEEEEVAKYCEEEDVLFGALHAAALADDVTRILEELDGGADPRARDSKGRVPYYLCTTQAAREAFRRWRGGNEEAWDWTAAQVPEGITDESEQKRREKEKEKRKKQKEKQKASKAKAKEEEEDRLRKEEEERRILEEAQAKCEKCRKPLSSKPFTRLNFLYCSPECVNGHRRDLQAEAALKRLG
ncbi:unnamed protein product [Effrenium voratum]|uniref:VLRF1 domain-containing protein n=1 Tax=Effrenium voratum TaxID=2562239 RepID=A0AA36MR32_9DINO|nr:unnamed protein product [Effrenium voratum]